MPDEKRNDPEQEATEGSQANDAAPKSADPSKVREKIISKARMGQPAEKIEDADASADYAPSIPEAGGDAPQSPQPQASPPDIGAILQTRIAPFGPNLRDMSIFCRQLSTLLDVGIPLLQSLKILAERTVHPSLRRVVAVVAQRIEEGNTLSSALREHPKTFSFLFVSVVEVGELGGILEGSVRRLAEIMEMKASMKRKITSALMYPSVALLLCAAVVALIVLWAVPRFQGIYKQLGDAELPGPTLKLIAISDFARDYPLVYIPLLAAAAGGLYAYGRTPAGRSLYDWLLLRLYLIGPINTRINVARFTRSLGAMVAAGIPLLEALKVTAKTCENVHLAGRLQAVHDSLERGGRLEEPLRNDPTIPPMVTDMMVIGYEAGAIDDMLIKIADIYDEEVEDTLQGLATLIEPALIIMLGLVVLFVFMALVLPYFNLVRVV